MTFAEPKVHLIAATEINRTGLHRYLKSIGAIDHIEGVPDGVWTSDAKDDMTEIVEVMSRSCYKSFGTELNANLTKTRAESDAHIANILKVKHGSVLEHAWCSWMFTDVTRVFTHELVRHRAGVAISQESMRFVRMDDIKMQMPACFDDNNEFAKETFARQVFLKIGESAEEAYALLLGIAAEKEGTSSFDELPFAKKKIYTSAARRVLPIGICTNIGWSCNLRALRHVIQMRTHRSAESEIRKVFELVALDAADRWPSFFQDMQVDYYVGDIGEYSFKSEKV